MDVREMERVGLRETERIVQAARDQVPGDVGVTTVVRGGDPGQEIVAQINEGRHDLVVLGSRGRGRIASGVLGSVVGDVHFATRVPMLVIHPQGAEE
jgi:nucleotide-binding universal stress UspA family protein